MIASAWTHKVKRRAGSVRVFIRSFTALKLYIYIFFSALPECGWALGHVPSPSLVSLKVQTAISNPRSTLAIFLFNETKNKVKIKPIVIYQREIIQVIDAVMPYTSRALRRLDRNLKEG